MCSRSVGGYNFSIIRAMLFSMAFFMPYLAPNQTFVFNHTFTLYLNENQLHQSKLIIMAKVKNTGDTNKQPGKAASSKEKANANEVVAVRNGESMTFTRQIWDNLPPGKDGWEEEGSRASVKTSPAAPVTIPSSQAADENATVAGNAKEQYAAASAEYEEVFGEKPGQDLTIDQIKQALADKREDDNE